MSVAQGRAKRNPGYWTPIYAGTCEAGDRNVNLPSPSGILVSLGMGFPGFRYTTPWATNLCPSGAGIVRSF